MRRRDRRTWAEVWPNEGAALVELGVQLARGIGAASPKLSRKNSSMIASTSAPGFHIIWAAT